MNEAITLRPIEIRIGPKNENLSITDGPTALGYIFSVAIPTQDVPKMENYYLPLLTIYSRATYLAYICIEASPPRVENVPIMCCVMYVVPKDSFPKQPQFFLSSSWSGNYSPEEDRIRQAEDPWRKEVLASFLGQITGTGEGMPKPLPVFEPSYPKELCCLFWKNFRGKGNL